MSAARKTESLDDTLWIVLPEAAAILGWSRLRVLTRAIKGELEAKHFAGRTVISRESVERILSLRNIA